MSRLINGKYEANRLRKYTRNRSASQNLFFNGEFYWEMAKVALPPEKVVRKIFPAGVALKLAPLIMKDSCQQKITEHLAEGLG
jgi:hypothetical protein